MIRLVPAVVAVGRENTRTQTEASTTTNSIKTNHKLLLKPIVFSEMSSFSSTDDSPQRVDDEDSAGSILMKHVTELLDDCPKLDVALKNLIAVVLGSDASRRSVDNSQGGKVTGITTSDLLLCSKALIKSITDKEYPAAPQWGADNPQREDQSFSDRLAEIGQYKAAVVFFKRAKESKSGVSKIIGRRFIQQTKLMPYIDMSVRESLRAKVEDDIIDIFLETFEKSIAGLNC